MVYRLLYILLFCFVAPNFSLAQEVEKHEDGMSVEKDGAAYLHFPRFGFGFANLPHNAPCPVVFYHDGIGIALDSGFCPAEDGKKPMREVSAYGSFNVAKEFPSARASARADCKGKPLLTRYSLDHHPSTGCRIEGKDGTVRLFTRTFRNSNAPDRSQWIEVTLQLQTTHEHWQEDMLAFETYLNAFRIDPDATLMNEPVR